MKKAALFALLAISAQAAMAQSVSPGAPSRPIYAAGGGSAAIKPSSETLSQTPKNAESSPAGKSAASAAPAVVINNKVTEINKPSQDHADLVWLHRQGQYGAEFYSGNNGEPPAALVPNSAKTLYPWIQMARRAGHTEEKISVEMNRLTEAEFKAWVERVVTR